MINTWTDTPVEEVCVESCPTWGELTLPLDPNCCPINELGQICGIYFDPCCNNPMPVFNPTRILEWGANIDNGDTGGTAVKYLVVEGSKGQPDTTTIDLPKGKTKVTKRTFRIEMEIKCETDLGIAVATEGGTVVLHGQIDRFMRSIQKGNTDFCFWYETLGGYFYGDAAGISPSFVDAYVVHENDKDSIRTWNLIIEFEALCDPLRTLNPLA